jgi:hypothetical protein
VHEYIVEGDDGGDGCEDEREEKPEAVQCADALLVAGDHAVQRYVGCLQQSSHHSII